ncbi:helix-turn-helix domain-containing protein [Williamsia muralis]|uniref:helix-turn-helix domain-containing protein n=2 Tax=Williamsia TaxID=85043 RepID=UPI0003D37361|nr:helix-turn-helix domain-containing protein [Williamsia marianensis]ETD34080.1 DNA-binding protein [Williamsia sp. D3]PZT90216.1 MAG: XRE family transcriptional regulator [Gordonia sp. (in: high G+C Gram-positive bacteria)]
MTQRWSEEIVERVGREVRRLRGKDHAKMSAAGLADRTAALGHPVSRSVIADLEIGRKKSLDVAELLVLAQALQVAPVQLVYPDLPKGDVEVLPGRYVESHEALQWFSGVSALLSPLQESTDSERSVQIEVREVFASQRDRVSPTREWLLALRAMRSAQSQLRRAVARCAGTDEVETLQYVYLTSKEQAERAFEEMVAAGMPAGDGDSGV